MPTFKAVVRSKRADGLFLVYIRVIHNRKTDYIKTDMYVHQGNVRKGEIADQLVLNQCAYKIKTYYDKLNKEDIEDWTAKQIVEFLTKGNEKIPFYPFCEQFIAKMINNNRERTAKNYTTALNSFRVFFGENICFQDIKSVKVKQWIETLKATARAKEMYPTLIKAMFSAGIEEFNDYDEDKILVKNMPFKNLEIPKADISQSKAVEAETIRKLFAVQPDSRRSELAQDVAKLILYLVGINTVDLFETGKDTFTDGKLCYNRSKTKKGRRDKAYIEIMVKDEILYLFDKYKGKGDKLFDFGYKDCINFNRNVNKGLKHLCELAGIEHLTSYSFRHTWATIAQNDCGAVTPLVGFCLNHSSEFKTTELYIKKKFEPIDELNNKVLDFIFNPDKYKTTRLSLVAYNEKTSDNKVVV